MEPLSGNSVDSSAHEPVTEYDRPAVQSEARPVSRSALQSQASSQVDPEPEHKPSSQSHTASYPDPNPGDAAVEHHELPCKMHKFTLYETASRYYLVGADVTDQAFRILKIDRTADSGELSLADDDTIYSKSELHELLNAIDDGNRASGGLKLRMSTWGLLGFIRFTGDYYMLLATKRSPVAVIGGHYIYQIDGTELLSLAPSTHRAKADRHPEEARFVSILNNLDLTRSFYFSRSYNITNTLQQNLRWERQQLRKTAPGDRQSLNEMFVWNRYLLEPTSGVLRNPYDWCIAVIHGFVDQATLSIYGRTVYITLVARRSRFFAGARFLKRGANDLGYVANDVETEQIVSEMLTTSFHAPGPRLFLNTNYTSYVQHRGSIPLYWTQDNAGVTPKPGIELNLVDPFYSAAAQHFDNLFERYGAPIFVLNLVKAREKTPRESKLLLEFTNAIQYLNQFLPKRKKILYKAWDMSRASKSRDQDVIATLEQIAEDVLKVTGIFHNGDEKEAKTSMQNGIARTNCIDCLDRTNAAQLVIGKLALGHQLHALGIVDETSMDYDTDAVNLFTHMFHDHGDTIAIQYGGSHLVNTMETYRKINQWSSHSRDMVESFKRYYNNSFLDGQRQEAYNLFLGNYIFSRGQPMLWDLSTDYYLHHSNPRSWSGKVRKNYINWFTPSNLSKRRSIPADQSSSRSSPEIKQQLEEYWLEYYRPLALSSFLKIFSFRMNSTLRYIPFRTMQEGQLDLSPFRSRTGQEHESPGKSRRRKGVTIIEPTDPDKDQDVVTSKSVRLLTPELKDPRDLAEQGHLLVATPADGSELRLAYGLKTAQELPKTAMTFKDKTAMTFKDKTAMTQWTLNQFVSNSLNPSVAESEMDEYGRYVSHPLNLPLVVSDETSPAQHIEFTNFLESPSRLMKLGENSFEEDIAEFCEFIHVEEDPLTVTGVDLPKKRYKAYGQWLRGKSLFKQSRSET